MMNFRKFVVFMAELAKLMFPWDQQRVKGFIDFLWPETILPGKVIHLDEHMKKLLDESIWTEMSSF